MREARGRINNDLLDRRSLVAMDIQGSPVHDVSADGKGVRCIIGHAGHTAVVAGERGSETNAAGIIGSGIG